jgi:hypothetical protein
MLTQEVRRRDSHIVVLDLKGDPAFFFGMAIEARQARVNFKWFTIESGKSSYIYNPRRQRFLEQLSLNERVQLTIEPLGVEHGEGHGPGFWGSMQEQYVRRFEERYPGIPSFSALRRQMGDMDVIRRLGMTQKDVENAAHVRAVIERLASVATWNATEEDGYPRSAIAAAIDVYDILSQPGITYFYLPASVEPMTVRVIARTVMRHLTVGARLHRGRRVPVTCVVDEAQEVLQGSRDLDVLVKQARDRGFIF